MDHSSKKNRREMLALGASAAGALGLLASSQMTRASATAEPVMLGLVSVKDYGAVGNGIADDTIAIQTAINNAQTVAGREGAVFFPTGHYCISDTLYIANKNNVSLIGMRASIQQFANNKDIIEVSGSTHCMIKDLYLSASDEHTGHGIKAISSPRLVLDNVEIYLVGGNCVWATDSWWLSARDCIFSGPGEGKYCVHHENEMNNVCYLHSRFSGGRFESNCGIFHKDGAVVSIIGCDFSGNEIAANIYSGSNIEFASCYFESNSYGIKWGDTNGNTWPQCCEVRASYFITSEVTRTGFHIDLQRGTRFRMGALKFKGNGNSGTIGGIRVANTAGLDNILIDQVPYYENLNPPVLDPAPKLRKIDTVAY